MSGTSDSVDPTVPAQPRSTEAGAPLDLAGRRGFARPSGALWVPGLSLLAAADLHFGKSERIARRGGALLPPYDGVETAARLGAEIEALRPRLVACLGDSFDDGRAAAALPDPLRERLAALQAGRRWLWIAGNHDPRAPELGGESAETMRIGPLILRHQAARAGPALGEVELSGHFHPKAQLVAKGRRIARRCFLWDGRRVILPAFGAYTGGLEISHPAYDALLAEGAQALLLSGGRVLAAPRTLSAG
ncbi:MAG: ligase-associated DNA damage response endonuclease PdeM [Pseudomonadota bacterium]